MLRGSSARQEPANAALHARQAAYRPDGVDDGSEATLDVFSRGSEDRTIRLAGVIGGQGNPDSRANQWVRRRQEREKWLFLRIHGIVSSRR